MGIVERMHTATEGCVLAFFTVVASCSNLSTFISGTKIVQGERKRKFQRANIEKMREFSLLSETEIQQSYIYLPTLTAHKKEPMQSIGSPIYTRGISLEEHRRLFVAPHLFVVVCQATL